MKIVGFEGIKAEYISHDGADIDVVKAARVSTGKETVELDDRAKGTLKYMAMNDHTTPFEMITVKMLITCPIFIARQFHRHRTFSYNEWSGRYSVVGEDFFLRKEFKKQDVKNKQGSTGEFGDVMNATIRNKMEYVVYKSHEIYGDLLDAGVSKEQARVILPVNMMTRFYAKNDLHNWMHYLKQRIDPHAQEEHQYLAKQIFKVLISMFPISVGLLARRRFSDEALESVGISREVV